MYKSKQVDPHGPRTAFQTKRFPCTRHQGRQRGQWYSSTAALAASLASLRSDGGTAGDVRSLPEMGIMHKKKSACEGDKSIHFTPPFIFTRRGNIALGCLILNRFRAALSAYFTQSPDIYNKSQSQTP